MIHALAGTPSGVSKFDFSDNFVSRNSAQIENFPSWHCSNSVPCIEQNSERALLKKYISVFISGMTDFAHLNECIVLANFKL